MNTILVVDDMAIFRDPIAASLRLAGYRVITAADGKEALAKVLAERPNLVLLDLAMPIMDGPTFLKALRSDPDIRGTPVILLTAVSDKSHVVQAAKLGVQDYLLKSRFSLKELQERICKYIGKASEQGPIPPAGASSPVEAADASAAMPATIGMSDPCKLRIPPPSEWPASKLPEVSRIDGPPGEIPRLLTREQCERRARAVLGARALSGVVAEVIIEAASPRSDMAQIAQVIAKDPTLSARVLQAANSAAYVSSRGMVTSIAEAVRHIGCATVRKIASTLGIFDALSESGQDGFSAVRCWKHSLATAMLCERLAGCGGELNSGILYLVGLCHDLGEILFHTHFGDEYRQVLDLESRTAQPREQLERLMLGMSQGELAMLTLECIGLPDSIRGPIVAFHTSVSENRDDPGDRLARVLALADLAANGMLLASSVHARIRPISRTQCRNATGEDHPARPASSSIRSEVFSLAGLLARVSARDASKSLVGLDPRANTRVLLVRAAALSSYDPIEAALESLGKVTVVNELPATKSDLEGYHALVVAAPATSTPGMTGEDIDRVLDLRKDSSPRVLWLVGHADPAGADAPPQRQPTVWPISLISLAGFLESVAAQQQPQPGADVPNMSKVA